ncbi:MAG: folate-binding protein YgfZ [Phycisphaerales bacterium]|nr:folate-binding protein YgfZ [Phycisphaerales bacterium]
MDNTTYTSVQNSGGYRQTQTRSLIEVTGSDRQSWLHNLTTNAINSLKPGDGNYAFAINVQGRTIFDLNALVLEDRLWLDIDARWAELALAHFDKYLIVEDVQLADITAEWARFEALGPHTADLVNSLGLGSNFAVLADVQHVAGKVGDIPARLVKNNLGDIPRAEFIVPATHADDFSKALKDAATKHNMVAIDDAIYETIRIEAGVPVSIADIDDQVIPPETKQVERGISYVKGCYLGQEVIERMRSRGSMARQLVGVKLTGDRLPEHNAPIFANGKEVGRVTSACHSPALDAPLALGYIKTLLINADQPLLVAVSADATTDATIIDLPLENWRS